MTHILLAGESWQHVSLFVKGVDVSTAGRYVEAGDALIAALEAAGATVTYQPCHVAHRSFPSSSGELDDYDVVLLSDIGARTLLVPPAVADGETRPNRCRVLADWVRDGGAVGMIGGYLSFAGEHGAAGYGQTALADVLPGEIATHDDRIERPAGVTPRNVAIPELPETWPPVLGYNRLGVGDASVWATVDGDPLVLVQDVGDGTAVSFTTDCAPHWATEAFREWDGLPVLWGAIIERLT